MINPRRLLCLIASMSVGLLFLMHADPAHAYVQLKCNGYRVKYKSTSMYVHPLSISFPSGSSWLASMGVAASQISRIPSKARVYVSNGNYANGGVNIFFVGSSDSRLAGAPARALNKYDCGKHLVTGADIVISNGTNWLPGTSTQSRLNLGVYTSSGSQSRSFHTVLIHEILHVWGLGHTAERFFGIMGVDYKHIQMNGDTGRAFVGADARRGMEYMFTRDDSRGRDLTVTHWKFSSTTSGGYADARQTQVYSSSSTVAPRTSRESGSLEDVYVVRKGQLHYFEFTYENDGPTSQQVELDFSLSSNRFISPSDRVLYSSTRNIWLYGPDTTRHNFYFPTDVAPGRYFLGVRVDPNNRIAEYDENNNATYIPIEVRN